MKKTIATLALVAMLALTGCGSPAQTEGEQAPTIDKIFENTISLQDGRSVTCLVRGEPGNYRGGLSCDWDGAK